MAGKKSQTAQADDGFRIQVRRKSMIVPSILQSAHQWASEVLTPGGAAIDATTGNGHDTLFLARQVGPDGHVFGFDIQEQAIQNTRRRLLAENAHHQVTLFQKSHDQMYEVLPEELLGKVQVVMFNLGYLPHGDKTIITRPDTTVRAMQQALRFLTSGGLLIAALYTGHPGGKEEAGSVIAWASGLSPRSFQVMWQQMVNRDRSPSLLMIEKRS
jgi:SAM-dependent methyltransferase